MRVLLVFAAVTAYAAGQGLFGGFVPNPASVPGSSLLSHAGDALGQVANVAKIIPGVSNVQNFAEFAAQTGKTYADEATKLAHEAVFAAHKQTVDAHNEAFKAGKSTFELGLNIFSDLNPAEFLSGLTGRKKSPEGEAKAEKHKVKASPPASLAIPDSFDWREKGGVTPVKFQGLECGACWAFTSAACIAGHVFAKTGNLIDLSEQDMIDCANDYGNTGCDGGYQEYAFAYVAENKGLSKADIYPYTEKQDKCQYDASKKGAEIKGFDVIPPKDENKMKEVIAKLGPLACSINAAPDSFQLYKAGIYTDEECNKEEVNHAVLVVGYGSENGQDYWIVKNSWSDKWGENGYFRLPRNKNSFCGIADECSYPVL